MNFKREFLLSLRFPTGDLTNSRKASFALSRSAWDVLPGVTKVTVITPTNHPRLMLNVAPGSRRGKTGIVEAKDIGFRKSHLCAKSF